ncbi:murein biosynthesis integral membrane protein MurJ [Prosthecodimorpha staleyi]|uniref:Probable lipid II flippase MurJ n=1 Tax=Prosthecodimorpha staleyi TaxID=2840188 RepID=A0A947GF79_9HYPH|nr:murein biosynthesis integral membrane protein MurJ [Prosthecodimorpha staleyi]MBT9292862.1 murein biosynthesis integral membrane protein MurJ [Prosthecodimorpha staleyi]
MTLFRNFLGVGAATMVSRILGFLRDTMIAAALGTGPAADAFFVAFRLPNLFRRFFAEGAFNTAFIPLYSRALEADGPEAASRFASEALSALLVLLALVTGLAVAFAPALVFLLAPGFAADPAKFDLAVLMTRICFPYLALISVGAMLSGVLNAHRLFLFAAFVPALLNLVLIAFLFAIRISGAERTPLAGTILSIGVAVAGLAQCAALVWGVRRAGIGFPIVRPRLTAAIRRLARLGTPGVIAGGITQINLVVGTIIASLSAGSVSYLYYADRVYQLPLGIVGAAIGVVLLPEIARQVRADREDLALAAQNRSIEFAAVLTLPSAVALAILAGPIVEVLFERGAFGPQDTMKTASALAAYAFGLPAFVLVKVFAPGFFAREDTATPMWIGMVTVAVNIALALALFPLIDFVAVAIATSVAGWVNAGLLWLITVRRGHWRADWELESRLPRIAASAAVMGMVLYLLVDPVGVWTGAENGLPVKAGALGSLIALGLALFFGVAQATGAVDLGRILRQMRRRPT